MSEWIGGRRPVAEALAAGRPAHRLLVSSSAKPNPELNALIAGAREAGISVQSVARDSLSRTAGFDGHQGVLLAKRTSPDSIVFLFQLEDYYIETYCNSANKTIEEYRILPGVDSLRPYLEAIAIDDLLN